MGIRGLPASPGETLYGPGLSRGKGEVEKVREVHDLRFVGLRARQA